MSTTTPVLRTQGRERLQRCSIRRASFAARKADLTGLNDEQGRIALRVASTTIWAAGRPERITLHTFTRVWGRNSLQPSEPRPRAALALG